MMSKVGPPMKHPHFTMTFPRLSFWTKAGTLQTEFTVRTKMKFSCQGPLNVDPNLEKSWCHGPPIEKMLIVGLDLEQNSTTVIIIQYNII